jgi:hypothetical protein
VVLESAPVTTASFERRLPLGCLKSFEVTGTQLVQPPRYSIPTASCFIGALNDNIVEDTITLTSLSPERMRRMSMRGHRLTILLDTAFLLRFLPPSYPSLSWSHIRPTLGGIYRSSVYLLQWRVRSSLGLGHPLRRLRLECHNFRCTNS